MINFKLKLLQALMYSWDVFFTLVDNTQLRIYCTFIAIKTQLIAKQHMLKHPIKNVKINNEDIQQNWEDLLKSIEEDR